MNKERIEELTKLHEAEKTKHLIENVLPFTEFFIEENGTATDKIFITFSQYYATGEGTTQTLFIGYARVSNSPSPNLDSISIDDFGRFAEEYREYDKKRDLLKEENRLELFQVIQEKIISSVADKYTAQFPSIIMNLTYFMLPQTEEGVKHKKYLTSIIPGYVINMLKGENYGNIRYASQFHVNFS